MSYFYVDEMNISRDTLDFQYPENTISKRHIEKKIDGIANSNQSIQLDKREIQGERIDKSKIYYEIILSNNKPNLNFSQLQPTSFSARKFYLYGLLHNNVANITDNNQAIIGEFVIEHAPKNAMNQRIYSCYLLEQKNDMNNDIDNLISFASNTKKSEKEISFDIQPLIRKQSRCIHYVDNFNHIFIFLDTIPVNEDSASFLKTLSYSNNLLQTSSLTNHQIIDLHKDKYVVNGKSDSDTLENESENEIKNNETKNTESFIGYMFGDSVKEGMEDEIYIDCQPVNESDESEIAYTKRLMKGKDSQNEQADTIYKLISSFFYLLFIAFFVRLSIPIAYKLAILKSIVSWKLFDGAQGRFNDKGEYVGEQNTFFKFIRIADYWIMTGLLLYILRYFILGTYPTRKMFTLVAVFLIVFAVFAYSIIQSNKKDLNFMKILVEKGIVGLNYDNMSDDEIGKDFYIDFISFPFVLIKKLLVKPFYWFIYIFYFIVLAIIFALFDIEDRSFIITEYFFFNSLVLTPFSYLMASSSSSGKNKQD